jgi:hypothetical protein
VCRKGRRVALGMGVGSEAPRGVQCGSLASYGFPCRSACGDQPSVNLSGHKPAAKVLLTAFIVEVKSQAGKKIPAPAAAQLVTKATTIKSAL